MDAYGDTNDLSKEKLPVLFVHGGGFSTGSRRDQNNQIFCQAIAAIGFHVFSMDYRLHQIGTGFHCDVSTEDKRTSILWAAEDIGRALKHLSSAFPEGVIVCGSSAGAEAALHAAFHLQNPLIRGVISIAGAVEPLAEYIDVPVLAFHGTCDALVPFGMAIHHFCPENSPGSLLLAGAGALAKCIPRCQLYAYQNSGHELTAGILTDPMSPKLIKDFMSHFNHPDDGFHSFEQLIETTNDNCHLPPVNWPCP